MKSSLRALCALALVAVLPLAGPAAVRAEETIQSFSSDVG